MLGGVPGVNPGTVVVIGGGVTGKNAARTACGLGTKVFLLENRLERLRYLSDVMPKNCFLYMSNPPTIRRLLKEADVVVGAVLIPGSKAPKLVTKGMLKKMKKGAVLVDIAIDQGGAALRLQGLQGIPTRFILLTILSITVLTTCPELFPKPLPMH